MSDVLPRRLRARWLIGLASLALACGPSTPPNTPAAQPPPAVPAAESPPSAELLTAQAISSVAALGEQGARPALSAALAAWERELGQPMQWFDASSEATAPIVLAASKTVIDPTGKWFARSEGNQVVVFDTSTWRRERILQEHRENVRSIVFGPHGKRLWSSSADGTVNLWDIPNAKLIHASKDNQEVDQLLLSPDGTRVVFRCGYSLCSWRTDGDAPEARRMRAPDGCLALRHWLAGSTVIAGKDDEEPCFLDVMTGVEQRTMPFVAGALLFPNRGDTFLAALPAARTMRVEVWSASKGQRLRSLAAVDEDGKGAAALTTPSLSPDGSYAVALSEARLLTRWDTTTGKVVDRLALPVDVRRADYLGDGRVLLSHASGNGFDLTNQEVSDVQPAFHPPTTSYHTIELTPDGKGFAAGIQDHVQVWDLTTGTPSYSLHDDDPIGRSWLLRFSSDGKYLVALHARGVRVWDLAAKSVVYRTKPEEGQRITAVAFDQEGRLVTTRSIYPPIEARGRTQLRPAGLKGGEVVITKLAGSEDTTSQGFSLGPHAAVQISTHAERIAIAPPGRGVRVFDTARKSLVREIPVGGTWFLSPDGAWIAYVGVASTAKTVTTSLQVVRVSDGKEWVIDQAPTPAGPVAWRPDSALFAASVVRSDSGHDVVLIDPESRSVTARTQLGTPPGAYYLTLMPDGARLLTRYRQGGMSFHRITDGASLATLGFMDDGETWLAWTEPGTFDMGGPQADQLVGCHVGPRILPFVLCATKIRKRGLLGEALRGQ